MQCNESDSFAQSKNDGLERWVLVVAADRDGTWVILGERESRIASPITLAIRTQVLGELIGRRFVIGWMTHENDRLT